MASNGIVRYALFHGGLASWPALCEQAAAFATQIGRERLITISQSEDKNDGVLVVWY